MHSVHNESFSKQKAKKLLVSKSTVLSIEVLEIIFEPKLHPVSLTAFERLQSTRFFF
jgi:hypothetical protein